MITPASTTPISSDTSAAAITARIALPTATRSAEPAVAAKAVTVHKQPDVRREQLDAELAHANRKLAADGNEVRFEYDREASSLIVRLVDTGTKEVLRQFPSNEALHAARMVQSGKPLISFKA